MEFITIVLFYANAILFIILMRKLYLNKRSVIINGLKEDNKELSDSLEIKKKSNTRMVTRIVELERQVYDLSRRESQHTGNDNADAFGIEAPCSD